MTLKLGIHYWVLEYYQEADDLETWYTLLGTRVLPMFSYDDPGLTLTIL